jgi:hypothetical protein
VRFKMVGSSSEAGHMEMLVPDSCRAFEVSLYLPHLSLSACGFLPSLSK